MRVVVDASVMITANRVGGRSANAAGPLCEFRVL
jgi:hypothetical protein